MAATEYKIPKIIIDCDPGIDDSQAISMVLQAHKRGLVDVLCITTVNGNTTVDHVNKNVLRLLEAIEMLHIPVFGGAATPISFPYHKEKVPYHGYDGFKDLNLPAPDPEKYIQKQSAVIKIIEEVKQHQGNLAILAIGPLTNIALVKMIEPELFSYLHSLHIMGGNYTGEGNTTVCGEFNFAADPEAAQIVLSDKRLHRQKQGGAECKDLARCPVYIVPWETCRYHIHIPFEFRRELGTLKTKEAELFNKFDYITPPKEDSAQYTVCDQVSAAWMLDTLLNGRLLSCPGQIGQKKYSPLAHEVKNWHVTVETQGVHCRGQMVVDRENWIDSSLQVNILTKLDDDLLRQYLEISFGK